MRRTLLGPRGGRGKGSGGRKAVKISHQLKLKLFLAVGQGGGEREVWPAATGRTYLQCMLRYHVCLHFSFFVSSLPN